MSKFLDNRPHRIALCLMVAVTWLYMTWWMFPHDTLDGILETHTRHTVDAMYEVMLGAFGLALIVVSAVALLLTPITLSNWSLPSGKILPAMLPFWWVAYYWVLMTNPQWEPSRYVIGGVPEAITIGWLGVAASIASPFVIVACWQMCSTRQRQLTQARKETLSMKRETSVNKSRARRKAPINIG